MLVPLNLLPIGNHNRLQQKESKYQLMALLQFENPLLKKISFNFYNWMLHFLYYIYIFIFKTKNKKNNLKNELFKR